MSENQSVVRHKKHKLTPKQRRNRKINNILVLVLLCAAILTTVLLVINTVRTGFVSQKGTSGSETSLSANTDRSMQNDLYEIGNNPTELEKTYFQQLTDALNNGTKEEIAEAVVFNFVSDYFTWTNKDGNYEVGGLQYIYSDKYSTFEEWSRYNYYEDLDLYINQYGRDNLPEVTEVTTEVDTFKTDDFTVATVDPAVTLDCYQVQVTWKYSMSSSIDSSAFPTRMRFQVVDNNGRLEVAEFYDMDSVEAWEASNGSSSSDEATETEVTE